MKKMNLSFLFCFMLFVMFIVLFFLSFSFYSSSKTLFIETDLMNLLNGCGVTYLVLVDWFSLLFMSVVFLISSVVMMYSLSYMSEDSQKNSFYTLVFLFVFSMFLMVMSPHLLSILLGWDGLGLVSYALVIYYKNVKSMNAGMVTFLSNRIGDLGIIMGIAWCLSFGSFNVLTIEKMFFSYSDLSLFFIIMISAMTKSAQIPFSAWLPAAMAAPTPVSSLVHSSTLVTAGVYLLIRFDFLISMNYYLFLFSCLTMIMSGASALFEMDFKKIIALSTLSQLGVMMFSLSIGMKDLAFFHLLTHALFKSLLFLCAGFYIHSNFSWQDIRSFTKIYYSFPLVSLYFSVASLALSGAPFLAGFYSKDLIIEYFFMASMNSFAFIILLLATAMTLIYSIRLIYLTFIFKSNSSKFSLSKEDYVMLYPMAILFVNSVMGGAVISWCYFPWLFISLTSFMKMLVSLMLLLSMVLVTFFSKSLIKNMKKLVYFMSLMWLIPMLSMNLMMYAMSGSIKILKLFDQGWLEYFGGQGISSLISSGSMKVDASNIVNLKSLLFLTSLIILIFILAL